MCRITANAESITGLTSAGGLFSSYTVIVTYPSIAVVSRKTGSAVRLQEDIPARRTTSVAAAKPKPEDSALEA